MTVQTTYEQVGIKEDIADLITNIDPTNTPFLSSIKTDKVHNKFYQWQEDHLRSAGLNAQSEGFTASAQAAIPTNLRDNYTQILSKTVQTSGTADAVQTYGRAKELAYQLAKAGAEIKRDLEYSLVGSAQVKSAGDDGTNAAGTPRQFAGYQAQILTAAYDSTQPTLYYADNASFTAPGTAATAPLTEDAVLAVDQQLYNNGAEGTILMVKPSDSLKVADFAYKAPASAGADSGRQRRMDGSDTKVVNVVDVYRSPYGEKKVVMDRFSRGKDAFVFDPKFWSLATLRPWTRETLAKTGDSTPVMIVGEYGLKHRNYGASALITNLA